jgi:hypothetical protein
MAATPERGSSNGGSASRWGTLRRWLQPGLGVKRWLLAMVVGTVLFGLGVALLLLNLYRVSPGSPFVSLLRLDGATYGLRILLLLVSGVFLLYLSVFRLNRTLLAPYLRSGKPVVEAVAEHRRLGRGPKVVRWAVTGNRPLAWNEDRTGNLTAIVTVADDGGSSKLRRSLGCSTATRNCLRRCRTMIC